MHTSLFFPGSTTMSPPEQKGYSWNRNELLKRAAKWSNTCCCFCCFQIIRRKGFTPLSGIAGVYPGLSGENHGAMYAALQPVSKEVETHLHSPMSGLAAWCMYLFSSSYTYHAIWHSFWWIKRGNNHELWDDSNSIISNSSSCFCSTHWALWLTETCG